MISPRRLEVFWGCFSWTLSLLACGARPEPTSAARAEPAPPAAPPAAPAGAAPPIVAKSTEPAAAPSATLSGATTTRELPSSCQDSAACFPPAAFTDAVCRRRFPDLPLYLFAKRMPWQHLYVKAEWVEPVNAHGGEQSEAWMQFGEEVVVLRKRSAGSGKGVQMSGPTDLDVLRWDGTCATIRAEMLVNYVPAPMQSPRIVWKYLGGDVQQALLQSGPIARARDTEKKACRDSSVSHPTPACEKAMRQLTDAIVLAVHQDVELPATGRLPEWAK
jgi:hypothetical protein